MISRRNVIASALASSALMVSRARGSVALPGHPNSSVEQNRAMTGAALCVGISSYPDGFSLKTPVSDAQLLAGTFRALGFSTTEVMNPTADEFLLALAQFRMQIAHVETAIIYVAGHGTFLGGDVFVYPSDIGLEQTIDEGCLPESVFVTTMSDRPRNKVLLLDCCRAVAGNSDVTISTNQSAVGGLFSLYAAQPRAPAYDGLGENGPFASQFAKHLSEPGLQIEEVAKRTRLGVLSSTGGAQIPWSKSSLLNSLVLNPQTV